MQNPVSQILHRAKSKGRLNILGAPTHEAAQSNLALTNHNFYFLLNPIWKTWNNTFRPLPKNCVTIDKLPIEIDFDCILSEQKVGQFQNFYPLAKKYGIPLISITHTWPYDNFSKAQLANEYNMKGDINLFISKEARSAWGWKDSEAEIIEHYVNTDIFRANNAVAKTGQILTVCNQFSKPVRYLPCNFPLWQNIIQPNTNNELSWKVVGDDPGFAQPAKSLDELVSEYQKCSIYINTTRFSPIPMSLLDAAACECAIVSTSTCSIPDIFKHNETALLSNDPKELREFCIELLKNESLRKRLGTNARELIKSRFNKERYIKDWNRIFDKIRKL